MPKVTQEYIRNKKDSILAATKTVLKNKTLYEVTMLDIIHQAGLSKGGIYRYYEDIDALLIEFINASTSSYNYNLEIQEIINSPMTSREKITKLLLLLGDRIENAPSIIGKIHFELNILVSTDQERGMQILRHLDEQDSGQLLMHALFQNLQLHLSALEKKPTMTYEDLVKYIQVYIEGLVKVSVFERCYGIDQGQISPIKMVKTLDRTIDKLLL